MVNNLLDNKKRLKVFFDDIYGKEDNLDSSQLVVGIIMSATTLIILGIMCANLKEKNFTIDQYIGMYIIVIYFVLGLFISSSYLFRIEQKAEERRKIKYGFFIATLILICIVFLPVTIILAIIYKIKFINMYVHIMFYGLSLIITSFLDIIVFCSTWKLLENKNYIDCINIAGFVTFIFNYICLRLIAKFFF